MPFTKIIVLTCFVMNWTARAQEVAGNLEGRISDLADQPVVGANVVAHSPSLQGTRGTSTDEHGVFRLFTLPPGIYSVRITHLTSSPLVLENVPIQLGRTTGLGALHLRQKEVEIAEVVVVGDHLPLDPVSTAVGTTLTRQNIDVLPMDRTYRGVATILPHNNPSYFGDDANVAGATGSENKYFVNGTDVTDTYTGTGSMNLPYNFIREIQVMSGGYEAQYRSALGGIMNVVTNSGGNIFSGEAFGFYTDRNFSSAQRIPQSAPPEGAFSQYDFGFGLGGPILTDRLWFYAAYSPSFRHEDVRLPGLGEYRDENRAHIFAGKLTWKGSERFDMSATLLGDPTRQKGVTQAFSGPVLSVTNPDPYLSEITKGGYAVLVEARHEPSDNVAIDGSVSWTTRFEKQMPGTQRGASEVLFYDAEQQTISGGYPLRVDNTSTALTAQMDATLTLGQHALKAGLAYKIVELKSSLTYSTIFRYPDPVFGSTYLLLDISQIGKIRNSIPSVFLQDSWSLGEHFRLNCGVRWDGLFIVGSNGELAQRILGQYQPRVGFVLLPAEDGADRITGSFGRYAEDLLLYGSTLYHIDDAHQVGLMYTHDPRVDPSGADTVIAVRGVVQAEIEDLQGQYYDEFTLGYEHLLAERFKVTVRGIYRTLRSIIEDAEAPPGSHRFSYANPGAGPLGDFPKATREYLALELGFEKSWGEEFNILVSYVLSRNYGNYPGLFGQEAGSGAPNAGPAFDFLYMTANATGLLSNDRTHVLKISSSYRTDFGVAMGASFFWASGTPLSITSVGPAGDLDHLRFLEPRGSAGRLPSIWDLNLRVSYDIPLASEAGIRPRCILDIFHVASLREVVQRDQLRYLDDAGTVQNQAYGIPLKFQPPMSLRLGMEVGF